MIPVRLTLRNFLSYRDEAELDFHTLSIACLSGDNGAGKSAILDAITWAVWGKTRASNDRDVVSTGEVEMDVTFIFQLGEREYRVFRRRSFTGRAAQTIELDVREPGGGDWLSISGDTVRETEQKIISILNMEYDTFVNSAFILQGRADSFTQKPPSERKKILGDILNLQEYDELTRMARDDAKLADGRLNAIRGRIDALDEQLARRPGLAAELAVVSAHLTDTGQKLDLAQELCDTLKHQLALHERGKETLNAAAARAERETLALAALDAQRAEREREQAALHSLVADAAEIEAGAEEHERWRSENARFTVALRQVKQLVTAQHEAEQAISQQLATLQRARDQHAHVHAAAQKQLDDMDRDEQRLATLRADAAATAGAQQQLDSVRAAVGALRDERSTLQTENKQLRERMDEIKAHLTTLETGEADCPVCRRPLSPADRERVRDTWQTDGTALGNRFRANKSRVEQIAAEVAAHEAEEQRLGAIVQSGAARDGQIQQLESELLGRDAVRQQIDQLTVEIAATDRTIAAEDFAHESRERLAATIASLTALDYDEARHTVAADGEAHFAPYIPRRQELDVARTRLQGIEEAIAALVAQSSERRQAVEEAGAEITRLLATLTLDERLPERVAEAVDDVDRLSNERNEHWSRQGGIERQLAELDRFDEERARLSTEATALGLDSGALRELSEAFGRNGIQALIIESILPELEDKANELLQRMSSSNLRVSFRSQREALSSDRMIETLDIIIRDEYGERPYALYSGGEAFRVNFAVRVALSKLLARRAGANIDMLVIDEGFGTQDSRGRDGLIEALRSIEGDFRKILVITHIGEIRELFPTRIDVVKGDRGSTITVS
ncbi:MAG TPA: SMC family ATPase [Thermomicrobiales bacterium]|nr:SMC family ATPase [Thermomicrobiales bacterium]